MRIPQLGPNLVYWCVFQGRAWLVVGAIWIAVRTETFAAEAQNEKLSRLGFKFDQRAHDDAVAARQRAGGSAMGDERADPDVLRLPRYTVTEQRSNIEERELLTRRGRIDVATKRYISPVYGRTLGPLTAVASFLNNPLGGWSANTPEAMALYEDDEQKRRNARAKELNDLAGFAEKVKRRAEKNEKPRKK